MLQLENLIDPSVFRRFIQGFLTVRRSDKFSCGTSTDMIIEQSLMKSMQTDGGISRGRSTQESVISKRVYSMHATNTVCERMEDIGNVKMDTTDTHDRAEIFDAIFEKYVHYAHRHFGHNGIIIIDGYSDYTKNTKVSEQHRRTTKISSSSDVLFDRFMTVPTNRQKFLANTHNKSCFISMLSEKLKAADIFVKQANNDADVLII
ncbi:hypothetical protein AVEN_31093-1 [Araneus ventricosus]|uniref:Uncharacterized protein n=1 Tax=Araneus ventricosus TaxID=182803 RepID=A0A4Y2KR89_ARAVE|nr:hypothetical protein AVEN_31093-1 [Araneus ventricosus]